MVQSLEFRDKMCRVPDFGFWVVGLDLLNSGLGFRV